MSSTPKTGLPLMTESQDGKYLTHNEMQRIIDVIIQGHVIDKDRDTPPTSKSDGDTYIIAAGGKGDWSGKATGTITFWDGTSWNFIDPSEGWKMYIADEGVDYRHDGSGWVPAPADIRYDLIFFVSSKPSGADEVYRLAAPRDFFIPDDGGSSQFAARVAATASTTFLIKRNGVQIGIIKWSAGQTRGVITMDTTNEPFYIDGPPSGGSSGDDADILSVEAPAIADATLADIGFAITAELI